MTEAQRPVCLLRHGRLLVNTPGRDDRVGRGWIDRPNHSRDSQLRFLAGKLSGGQANALEGGEPELIVESRLAVHRGAIEVPSPRTGTGTSGHQRPRESEHDGPRCHSPKNTHRLDMALLPLQR